MLSYSMHSFRLQLDSDMELKDLNSIHQLCLSCDLPAPNATNRKRLAKELLFYTVMSESIRVSNSNLQRILRGILLRKEKKMDLRVSPLKLVIWSQTSSSCPPSYAAESSSYSGFCSIGKYKRPEKHRLLGFPGWEEKSQCGQMNHLNHAQTGTFTANCKKQPPPPDLA